MLGIRILMSLVLTGTLVATGCGKKEETPAKPDEGGASASAKKESRPKTFGEAVAALAKHRDELAAGYASGEAAKADLALHDVIAAAEAIEDLGTEAGLDRYDWNDAKTAADQIIEIGFALHDKMGGHGSDAKVDQADYDKESDSLNDAISNLEAVLAKSTGG